MGSRAEVVPLAPDRQWDLPGGVHVGHGCALRVPVSEGPSNYLLDRGNEAPEFLGGLEPTPSPDQQLEFGEAADARRRWEETLNRAIVPRIAGDNGVG